MESWLIPPDPVEQEIVYKCGRCGGEFENEIYYSTRHHYNVCEANCITSKDYAYLLIGPLKGYPKQTDILGL